MEIVLKISGDELSNVPYGIIAETKRRSIWNTGRRRRKMATDFKEEEMELVEKIIQDAVRYAGHNPKELFMTSSELIMWRRVANFCYEL